MVRRAISPRTGMRHGNRCGGWLRSSRKFSSPVTVRHCRERRCGKHCTLWPQNVITSRGPQHNRKTKRMDPIVRRRRKRFFRPVLLIFAGFLGGCDRLPLDPEETLLDAQRNGLRVGLIENPAWEDDYFSQAEIQLIEELSEEIGTDLIWIRGRESVLMPALERFELHVVIGGITDDTPWKDKIGLTRPYFINRFVIGTPPGRTLESISDLDVAVPDQFPFLRAEVRKKGATPAPLAELS